MRAVRLKFFANRWVDTYVLFSERSQCCAAVIDHQYIADVLNLRFISFVLVHSYTDISTCKS